MLSGCWWWLEPGPTNRPTVSQLLEKCRNEARAAFYDGGTQSESEDVYERCVEREGVQ
jgi:hypothetical protein